MLHVTHTLFIAVQYVLVAHDLFTVTVLYSMQSRVCTVLYPGTRYPVLCTTVPFLLFSSLQAASCKLQAASCKLKLQAASGCALVFTNFLTPRQHLYRLREIWIFSRPD